ncbi:ER-derived vesicles protein erv29 [Thecaphora frezii]
MASYGQSPYSSSSVGGARPSNDSPIDKIREYTSKIEDLIDTYTQPIKPHLPALGRFLIVVTFFEDALRIVTQWSDQKYYLQRHRHFPWGVSHLFLIANVVVMIAASVAVITRKYPEISVGSLLGVVVVQGFGYGLIFDLNFFLRNLSVIGGLLMVLSDSLSAKKNIFAGLPNISETDRKIYFQLAGRVLLIFLFIGFIIQGTWSVARVIVSILGLGACIMVAVGFKARWSASFLVLLLSVFNILVNNFWTVHSMHPSRDFLRYDFFQTLSIVGGLLLLVNMGPGGFSMDERKKVT